VKPDEFRRDGDEFLAVWLRAGIGIGFSRIRESDSGMLFAELDVQSIRPDAQGTLLSPSRFNMMAATERKRLADLLGQRAPDVIWADALESAVGRIIREWRTPEPLVDLWDVQDPGELTYLHRPLLVENDTNIWYADEQSMKSYLAMATAASVVSGYELPGVGWPSRTGPVLYYDWETFDQRQRRRLTRVVNGMGLAQLRNIKYRRMSRPIMDVIGLIRAEVSRLGAVLVIFDSLGFMCGGDLNKPEIALPVINAVGSIQGATRLILAHHGKSGRQEGEKPSVFGSAFFEAGSRNRWLIRKSQEEASSTVKIGLYNDKTSDDQRHRPMSLAFAFDKERDSVTVSKANIEDEPELMKTASAAARIRAMLRRAEYSRATVDEISAETGLASSTVKKELNGMRDAVNLNLSTGGRGNKGQWGLMDLTERQTVTVPPLSKGENGNGFSPLRGETVTNSSTQTVPVERFVEELPF
jgi:hypothetical protein